jgi:endonuclease YncB( thermonuclease family)
MSEGGVRMPSPLYAFPGVIDRVKDGDTFVATIEVANVFHERHLMQRVWRLNGCNARESGDPTGGGKAAAANLASILVVGLPVTIHSILVDPYTDRQTEAARYEASVTLPGGIDLANLLIEQGWAAPWDGKTQPRPIPTWPRKG